MRIIGSLRPGCWLLLFVLGNVVAAGQAELICGILGPEFG